MRRAAWIFLAAILLPCLVLAWLAVRSEQDQQVILQHQQAIIDQGVADSLAQNVRTQMDGVIADFVTTTRRMLVTSDSPGDLARGFNRKIREAWPLAQIGFAVDLQGTIYAPERTEGLPAQTFRKENESFLSNREDAEVYSNAQNQLENLIPERRAVARASVVFDSNTAVGGNTSPAHAVDLPTARADAAPVAVPGSAPALTAPVMTGSLQRKREQQPSPASTDSSSMAVDDLQDKIVMEQAKKSDAQAGSLNRNADAVSTEAAIAPASSTSTKSAAQLQNEKTRTTVNGLHSPAPGAPVSSTASPAPTSVDQDFNQAVSGQAMAAAPAAPVSDAATSPSSAQAPAETTASTGIPAAEDQFSLQAQQQIARVERQVAPLENTRAPDAALSNVIPAQSDFRQLIGTSTSGSVARFLDDKLCLFVWSLPARNSIIFGAQLNQDRLVDKLRALVQPDANRSSLDSSFGARADYCLALLDDKGQPVALSQVGFKTDWKHPFVATEIGGVLPHWEAALYLTDPGQVSHSARVLHFTIGLIILLLVVAILAGGSLIGADVGRQMRLAQQKTDFVSNVSHELKTPLTSIRMFADMLAEGRVEDQEKQSTYLRIISAESARLTRLINNVLDFARLERNAPAGERQPCDLVDAAREVVETCQPHLESSGITLGFEVEAGSLPLMGDRDALSQIILNLISNAEKYGGGEIIVRSRRQDTSSGPMGCIDVLDRGPGIPAKQVESVFAPFRRLDDSLASGVPGSGLGLTLARRMARAHRGDVTYQPRADGGSCFTLALPLSKRKS
jgi:signal transduction histidine kinase